MLENTIVELVESRMIDYDDVEGIDLDQAAADVSRFVVPFKCEVFLAALAITEVCAGTTPGVVKMDKRPTLGSDTSRGNGDIGEFAMGTTAAGKLLYDLAGRGTILYPGDEVVVEITTRPVTGASGHFIPKLLVKPIPEMLANLTDMVETA